MQPSRVSWLALGLGAYLAFLVASFPAAIAARWFAPADLTLSAPSGSVWLGRAASAVVAGFLVSEIQWRISPGQLILGRLSGSLAFRFAGGFADTSFSLRPGGRADLATTRFTADIEQLAGVLPLFDTRGQVSATLDTLTLVDGWPLEATGEVRVGRLEVAPLIPDGSNTRILLGDFRAVIRDMGDGRIGAAIRDLDGPLELDGNFALNPDRSYLLQARLRARPDASPELIQGINLMTGEPDAQGMRELTVPGSL